MGKFWGVIAAGLPFLLCPSAIFNLLKLPIMWRFYAGQTADPTVAGLFVVFWLLLAFWVAKWGVWYFWASVLLQTVFAGLPDIRVAMSSTMPDLFDLHSHWSVWLFAAGLSLEILDWTKKLADTNRTVSRPRPE